MSKVLAGSATARPRPFGSSWKGTDSGTVAQPYQRQESPNSSGCTASTREAAAEIETKLKKLIDTHPRQINRMVMGFRDLVRELDYS